MVLPKGMSLLIKWSSTVTGVTIMMVYVGKAGVMAHFYVSCVSGYGCSNKLSLDSMCSSINKKDLGEEEKLPGQGQVK